MQNVTIYYEDAVKAFKTKYIHIITKFICSKNSELSGQNSDRTSWDCLPTFWKITTWKVEVFFGVFQLLRFELWLEKQTALEFLRMLLERGDFEIFWNKNQNYKISHSIYLNCIFCAQKCSISTENMLDLFLGDLGEQDMRMRNENLMRTPGNGDPGVPIANPIWILWQNKIGNSYPCGKDAIKSFADIIQGRFLINRIAKNKSMSSLVIVVSQARIFFLKFREKQSKLCKKLSRFIDEA